MLDSCMTKRNRQLQRNAVGAGGLGVSRYNDEGNWSALFAMMFKDSHITNGSLRWTTAGRRAGIWITQRFPSGAGGRCQGITARDDFANYVPLPFIFPLFSAGYKRVTVQFTYIPGTHNNGNVLFAWLRLGF